MSLQKCLSRLQEYLKKSGLNEKISDQRLREFARQLEVLGADSLTPAEFSAKAQDMIDGEQTRWYAKKQAENAMVLLKREQALKSILENNEQWKKDIAGGKSGVLIKTDKPEMMAREAFRAWLEGGSLRPGVESNLSVEKMSKSIQANLRDSFINAVRDVKDAAASGQLDRETYQELDALDRKLPLMQSGNQDALEYAKAIKVLRDKIFSLKQANNPHLEAASEYLLKQFHDRARVTADPSEAGKQAWLDQAMKTYGDKSFPEATIEEKKQIFKNIYDRIADGRFGTTLDDSASDKYLTVRGDGGNIMRRMSKARQLIAKDWQSQYEYASQYGPKTIYEGLDKVMSQASKDIATLSKFGPNPQGMYEGLYRRVLSRLDGPEAAHFEDSKSYLDKRFNVVAGSQNAPARGTAAKFVQGSMTLAYLAKTGFATLRSQPDVALAASLLRGLDGKTLLSHAAELTTEYYKGFGSATYAKERLGDLGMFSNAANQELMRMFGSADSQPGTMGKLVTQMGSLNLLGRHVDAMRSATGSVITKLLGDVSGISHEDLPPTWKKGLSRYGVGESEWNLMRGATEEIGGKTRMTPEAIERLPDDEIQAYLNETGKFTGTEAPSHDWLSHTRFDLALKLGTMINEHADLGSAHPDTRQRSFLWGDTNINQGWGMLARLMTQFKTAALVSNDVYRRGYFSGTAMKGDYAGVAQQVILATFLAGIGEYAYQLVSGKTPEDPTNPAFVAKIAASSGAAGIWGDVLISEMQRQGVQDKMQALANGILGPSLGTATEAAALGTQALSEAFGHERSTGKTGQKALGLFLGNIPGQNLFYTKAALNYYITNGLREFLGPGYLSYLERQASHTPGLGGGSQRYMFGRPTSQSFLGD